MRFDARAVSAGQWHRVALAAAVAAAICAICAFHVMDRDFWWHITAGRVMWETGGMIRVDPFAYTRDGLPYLATHEWLAQVILYGVFSAGGTTGVILFRTATMLAVVAILTGKRGWRALPAAAPFAVLAAADALPSFIERPQLFTFLCLAAVLRLGIAWREENDSSRRKTIVAAWIAVTIAWVNLHGGAALLSGVVWAAMAASWWWDAARGKAGDFRWMETIVGGLLIGCAMLVSPDDLGNASYVAALFTDRTTMFIHEWLPRESADYWGDQWIWWIAVPLSLVAAPKHRAFHLLTFSAFAYLSLKAFRHEVLFVLASYAITVASLAEFATTERWKRWKAARPGAWSALGVLALFAALWWAHGAYARLCQRDQLFGYGAFIPTQGAMDYVEGNGVSGNMFNTYGAGGYLIYRGYPDRRVYIDGRNVDYGFRHMGMTNVAGKDPAAFAALDEQYDFSYAIIDYDAAEDPDLVSYSVHLDTNPDWALVYIDDLAAVYLKRTPANAALIERDAYRVLDPSVLDIDANRAQIAAEDMPTFEAELRRAAEGDPRGVKNLDGLATLLIGEGKCADALPLVAEARKRQPRNPKPIVLDAACAAAAKDWAGAADLFDEALPLAGDAFPNINYGYIANVYDEAGRPISAWWLRLRTGTAAPASREGSTDTGSEERMPDPAADAMDAFARGIEAANAGDPAGAEKAFMDAVMFNPSDATAWNNLGAARIQLKRYDDAADALARSIERDPSYGEAELNMAIALYKTGKTAEARDHLDRAKALGTDVSRMGTLLD